jgi:2,4-dienoyl-CoA reductase-like NADH-dependent reductase (Old Yellow Enzyme family)
MKKYKELFQKIDIGNVTIPNRVVMPPMIMCYANSNREVNQEVISHFEARAKGGVGLIRP